MMAKPRGKIWKNVLSYTAGQASMALFGVVISAVLARYMSKSDFGRFSYLVALATLFLPILDMGATGFYTRLSSRERQMIGPHWARAIGLRVYSIPLTAAILAVYFYFSEGRIEWEMWLVLLYAISQSVMLSTDVAFRAGERGYAWAIRRSVYEISYFAMTVTTLAIFHLTTPLQQYAIAVVALALAAAWATTTVFNVTGLTWRQFRTSVFAPLSLTEFRNLWPFALNGALFVFYYRLTAVFIEHFGTSEQLADFRVVFVIMTAALYIPKPIIWATSPRMAWHDEQNDSERFHKLLQQSVDVNLYVSSFITVGGLVFGAQLVAVAFGRKYAHLGWLWYVIDVSMGLFFIQQFCADLLNNFHQARHVVRTLALGIAVMTVLNLILIPRYGALGAGWARLVAGAVMVPVNLRAVGRLVGGFSRLHGISLWRFLAANAAAAGLGLALLLINFWLSLAVFLLAYPAFSYMLGAMPAQLVKLLARMMAVFASRTP